MAINLKSEVEIEHIWRACRLVHEVLGHCREICRPGVETKDIDAEAERLIQKVEGAIPLFKNYPASDGVTAPFPAVTCISVNEEVVHGIPSARIIQEGDLVSIDFGVRIDGWCGDSATTVMVEPVTARHRRLCEVTEHVLQIAIENIQPGRLWSRIARQMQRYAEVSGLGVVEKFTGHGIGRELHEEPKLPNYVNLELLRNDIELQPGMVIAVEPMCTLGTGEVVVLDDDWTVATEDRQPAAHYEHTVVVTEKGCTVLTAAG